jgi:adenosylcobinamide-GDP ribazoletransferase
MTTNERHWVQDAALLSAGTFTAIPVPTPSQLSHRTTCGSVVLAPFWGLVISTAAAVGALICQWAMLRTTESAGIAALFGATVFVAVTAFLARGLHLDGLADTADGFASMRHGAEALQVMRDPRVGALGVVTVVFVIALQVLATSGVLLRTPDGDLLQTCVALMSIGVLARAPLPWLVRQGTPAASDGLGSAVVGQMPVRTAAVGSATATVVVIVALMVWWSPAIAFGAAVAAWVTAVGLRRSAIRRFQVVNGDVLGASIEMTALVGLLALAML